MSSEPLPSPRAHLAASLQLFDALAEASGGLGAFPGAAQWRGHLHRPRALPSVVSARNNGLKMDGYVTRGPDGVAWGFACNDRWEGRAFWAVARGIAADLDALNVAAAAGGYDVARAEALREALGTSSLTISVGFDREGAAPRLKLYLQEAIQGTGVSTVGQLRRHEALLGARLPAGLHDELKVGVVTLDLRADGSHGAKVYLGGAEAQELVETLTRSLPRVARELETLAGALPSPSLASYYYATLRLEDELRVALNPIYDVHRRGFGADGALDDTWDEVRALFAAAGRTDEDIDAVVDTLPSLRLVPTATAVERRATSADLYMAAWPR
ncbi:MAG: hypothetical protein KDA24_04270 [Deltaproteobacteria bacterium]|nr:hypothetical protein [Deltaproteobacteria bacterium]